MRSRFNHLRQLREKTRVDHMAQEHGYENAEQMVADLYNMERKSVGQLAAMLAVEPEFLRAWMRDWKIEVRKRGGPNNEKFKMTQQLVDETSRDGITAVSNRLGISRTRLVARLKEWLETHK